MPEASVLPETPRAEPAIWSCRALITVGPAPCAEGHAEIVLPFGEGSLDKERYFRNAVLRARQPCPLTGKPFADGSFGA